MDFSRSQNFEDRFYEVPDRLRLHYREYPGSADLPPLLCLHGLTRNARDFAAFAERYSPQFRVIALEFRGRGDSDYDPVSSRYNPLTYASDVMELLDQLSIGQAIFVGTSLGGLVTMAIAGMRPALIAGCILNDIGPDIDQAGVERILSYVGTDVRFKTWEEAAARIAANQQDVFPSFTSADWVRKAQRNCRERNGEIVFDYDPSIAEPFRNTGPTPKVDMWPLFAALAEKPLLVVRGELSDLLSEATVERMANVAPGAKFVTVPATGHAPELDEPEAFTAIDAFLNSFAEGPSASVAPG